jgi:hypothetical protein
MQNCGTGIFVASTGSEFKSVDSRTSYVRSDSVFGKKDLCFFTDKMT